MVARTKLRRPAPTPRITLYRYIIQMPEAVDSRNVPPHVRALAIIISGFSIFSFRRTTGIRRPEKADESAVIVYIIETVPEEILRSAAIWV
jgi:hypothetical protein